MSAQADPDGALLLHRLDAQERCLDRMDRKVERHHAENSRRLRRVERGLVIVGTLVTAPKLSGKADPIELAQAILPLI